MQTGSRLEARNRIETDIVDEEPQPLCTLDDDRSVSRTDDFRGPRGCRFVIALSCGAHHVGEEQFVGTDA